MQRTACSISASILSADRGALRADAKAAVAAGADSIHVDVMDGHYCHNFAFDAQIIPALKREIDVPIVVHFEIDNPEIFIAPFADAGADMIVVMEDTCRNLPRCIAAIRDAGAAAGVAVNPDRPWARLESHPELLHRIDLLIVMAVYPGFGGQRFAVTTPRRIGEAVTLRTRYNAEFEIGVDGGVNVETTPRIISAGGNQLIAGSAIFSGDIAANIAALRQAVASVPGR